MTIDVQEIRRQNIVQRKNARLPRTEMKCDAHVRNEIPAALFGFGKLNASNY